MPNGIKTVVKRKVDGRMVVNGEGWKGITKEVQRLGYGEGPVVKQGLSEYKI